MEGAEARQTCCLCHGPAGTSTSDWKVHLCYYHCRYFASFSSQLFGCLKIMTDAAYEAGRKSVLGDLNPEDER